MEAVSPQSHTPASGDDHTESAVGEELSVVISAGSSLLLVLRHNMNQMGQEYTEMPAAMEMGSEFITQTFLFLFLICPPSVPTGG